eukprot:31265-Pelagococcus_subviridis.AAC.9
MSTGATHAGIYFKRPRLRLPRGVPHPVVPVRVRHDVELHVVPNVSRNRVEDAAPQPRVAFHARGKLFRVRGVRVPAEGAERRRESKFAISTSVAFPGATTRFTPLGAGSPSACVHFSPPPPPPPPPHDGTNVTSTVDAATDAGTFGFSKKLCSLNAIPGPATEGGMSLDHVSTSKTWSIGHCTGRSVSDPGIVPACGAHHRSKRQ